MATSFDFVDAEEELVSQLLQTDDVDGLLEQVEKHYAESILRATTLSAASPYSGGASHRKGGTGPAARFPSSYDGAERSRTMNTAASSHLERSGLVFSRHNSNAEEDEQGYPSKPAVSLPAPAAASTSSFSLSAGIRMRAHILEGNDADEMEGRGAFSPVPLNPYYPQSSSDERRSAVADKYWEFPSPPILAETANKIDSAEVLSDNSRVVSAKRFSPATGAKIPSFVTGTSTLQRNDPWGSKTTLLSPEAVNHFLTEEEDNVEEGFSVDLHDPPSANTQQHLSHLPPHPAPLQRHLPTGISLNTQSEEDAAGMSREFYGAGGSRVIGGDISGASTPSCSSPFFSGASLRGNRRPSVSTTRPLSPLARRSTMKRPSFILPPEEELAGYSHNGGEDTMNEMWRYDSHVDEQALKLSRQLHKLRNPYLPSPHLEEGIKHQNRSFRNYDSNDELEDENVGDSKAMTATGWRQQQRHHRTSSNVNQGGYGTRSTGNSKSSRPRVDYPLDSNNFSASHRVHGHHSGSSTSHRHPNTHHHSDGDSMNSSYHSHTNRGGLPSPGPRSHHHRRQPSQSSHHHHRQPSQHLGESRRHRRREGTTTAHGGALSPTPSEKMFSGGFNATLWSGNSSPRGEGHSPARGASKSRSVAGETFHGPSLSNASAPNLNHNSSFVNRQSRTKRSSFEEWDDATATTEDAEFSSDLMEDGLGEAELQLDPSHRRPASEASHRSPGGYAASDSYDSPRIIEREQQRRQPYQTSPTTNFEKTEGNGKANTAGEVAPGDRAGVDSSPPASTAEAVKTPTTSPTDRAQTLLSSTSNGGVESGTAPHPNSENLTHAGDAGPPRSSSPQQKRSTTPEKQMGVHRSDQLHSSRDNGVERQLRRNGTFRGHGGVSGSYGSYEEGDALDFFDEMENEDDYTCDTPQEQLRTYVPGRHRTSRDPQHMHSGRTPQQSGPLSSSVWRSPQDRSGRGTGQGFSEDEESSYYSYEEEEGNEAFYRALYGDAKAKANRNRSNAVQHLPPPPRTKAAGVVALVTDTKKNECERESNAADPSHTSNSVQTKDALVTSERREMRAAGRLHGRKLPPPPSHLGSHVSSNRVNASLRRTSALRSRKRVPQGPPPPKPETPAASENANVGTNNNNGNPNAAGGTGNEGPSRRAGGGKYSHGKNGKNTPKNAPPHRPREPTGSVSPSVRPVLPATRPGLLYGSLLPNAPLKTNLRFRMAPSRRSASAAADNRMGQWIIPNPGEKIPLDEADLYLPPPPGSARTRAAGILNSSDRKDEAPTAQPLIWVSGTFSSLPSKRVRAASAQPLTRKSRPILRTGNSRQGSVVTPEMAVIATQVPRVLFSGFGVVPTPKRQASAPRGRTTGRTHFPGEPPLHPVVRHSAGPSRTGSGVSVQHSSAMVVPPSASGLQPAGGCTGVPAGGRLTQQRAAIPQSATNRGRSVSVSTGRQGGVSDPTSTASQRFGVLIG